MKKLLALMFLAFICFVPSTFAAAPAKEMVIVDSKSGHSFVPVRFLNGAAGTQVTWNDASKQVDIIKENVHLTLYLGQKTASASGKTAQLTDAPFRDNGAVYVPLQFISSQLGYQLEWVKENSSVKLTHNGSTEALPIVSRTTGKAAFKPIVSERRTFKVSGRSFSAQMITVSLLHPQIELDVVLAGNTPGKVEDLSSIAKRSGATVAINGTFFDAYTSGSYKAPYGYIVSHGNIKMPSPGDKRTMFTYDKNQLANLIAGPDFNKTFEQGSIVGGLQAGPRLLVNGKVSLDVKKEGFKDPKILTGGGARSALGITQDHRLILLTSSGATIPQLAEIMKQAGAYQAMNLDGGASSGLYYNGKYLTTPGRKISNAIVIKYQ